MNRRQFVLAYLPLAGMAYSLRKADTKESLSVLIFNTQRPLHECLFNPKTYHLRHSREGGNPVKWLIRLDSRLRGNDRFLIFLYKP